MATDKSSLPPLGTLVRMRPVKPAELPSHPILASLQKENAPALTAFISEALSEGHGFITEYMPKAFKVKSKDKPSPPSKATVELFAHEISAHDLPEAGRTMGASETWFARTSIHEAKKEAGTATWEEFDHGLRSDHSKYEKDYTPNILDAHKVVDWKDELAAVGKQVGDWRDVDMVIMEMLHEIPFPLNNRVFPVLVITARKDEEFLVVQVPVDTTTISEAKYSKDSKVTTGMYCSVERGDLLEGGTKVRWQMGTASDAKGVVPMWAQKLGVPGAVVSEAATLLNPMLVRYL